MNIYIGNLPKTTDEETIRSLFEKYGEVTEVKLLKDQYTNELRGFGFITMPAKAEAQKAIEEINDSELEGQKLIVNEARPRKDRPGGGSGGGGRRRGGGGGGGFGSRSRSW
ncbi:RNA-binding protein [candidate division KSB1 bacterium]|nr:RNA-binding protein [candidate division KSB1 bacterium]